MWYVRFVVRAYEEAASSDDTMGSQNPLGAEEGAAASGTGSSESEGPWVRGGP